MRTIGIAFAASALLAVAGCQTTGSTGTSAQGAAGSSSKPACLSETPLPSGLSVSAVSKDVPAEYAKFSGTWHGKWSDLLCHVLVVTSVNKDGSAEAVYSYGTYASWNVDQPGFFDLSGRIASGRLTLDRLQNGADVTYWFDGDNLEGMYVRGSETTRITMNKVE